MTFYEHSQEFGGKTVVEYELGVPLDWSRQGGLGPETAAYRLALEFESETGAVDLLDSELVKKSKLGQHEREPASEARVLFHHSFRQYP